MFRRLLNRFRTTKPKSQPRRGQRRLQLQRLANRELLAADLGMITGVVYTDLADDDTVNSIVNTSGATVNDPLLNGVDVTLYRDVNNNGTLELGPGQDELVGTYTTGSDPTEADGVFRFDGLSPDDYLLVQDAVAGLLSEAAVVPVTVVNDSGQTVQAIDDFSVDLAQLVVLEDTDPDAIGFTTDPDILGGNRVVILSNEDDAVPGAGGNAVDLRVSNNELQFNSAQQSVLGALVQYDGDADGVAPLNTVGLAGADLVQGNRGAGLLLSSRADQVGGEIVIRIYTDATNASETTVTILNQVAFDEFFVAFEDFTQIGVDGPADFENVGAIEFEINGVASLDGAIALIGSHAPVETVRNLVNFDPVTLGDVIFRDDNNNGVQDGGEPGLPGVDVNLYLDDGTTPGVLDAGDTLQTSTSTGAGGAYSFDGLLPGDYIVQIPASQFAGGGPLFGMVTSTGNAPTPDPDDDVDGDDNGSVVTGFGVASQAITLVSLGEPINDGDTDPNTNLTLDFGFVPETDLAVVKTLLTTTPTAGEEATFRITVTNNGNSVANNVLVTDVIPAGLVFDRVENVAAGLTVNPIAGSTVTASAATLGIGNSLSFDIVVDIPSSTTGNAIINEATVTADEQDPVADNDASEVPVPITVVTDLRLEKTGAATVVSGGTLSYTIVVTNDGPSDATGVFVEDELPTGLSFTGGNVEGDAAAVTITNGIVTADVGDLASGQSKTVTINVDVASNAPDTIDNSATVGNTPDTDAVTGNDSDNAVTTVERQVDLAITKTASANPIAGNVMTFTFLVENVGTGDARNVTVTDTLNDSFTFDAFNALTSGATLDRTGQDLEFDLDTLAAGDDLTFTVDVLIDPTVVDNTQIPNTAVVTTSDTDTVAGNNSSTVPVTVARQIDLTVTKDDNVTDGIPGQQITYNLTASNNGPSDASNVRIIDTLPAEFNLLSVVANGSTHVNSNGVSTFTIGDLAAGESFSVSISGRIDAAATGELINEARVEGTETESNPDNNDADLQTPLAPQFDLVLNKTAAATIAPGANLSYTIQVLNTNGPSDATGVFITDTLPASVTFVSATLNNVTVQPTITGNEVEINAGILASGSTATATITVAVAAGATGELSNTATVRSNAGELSQANNTDDAVTELVPDVDLTVSKTVSASAATPGTELTYEITVNNTGNSTATGVTATDLLPSGVTFVSGTGAAAGVTPVATANGQSIPVTIGTLAAGGSTSFTIIASINADASGELENNVSVATATAETNDDNNAASASTTVDPVLSSISGSVFVDLNNNGTQDTGEALAGVTIALAGVDTLGIPVTRPTTTTNAAGQYTFSDLPAGTYSVTQTQPVGFGDGPEQEGTVDGNDTNATVGNDLFSQIVLGPGQDATAFNFTETNLPFSKFRYLTPLRATTANNAAAAGGGRLTPLRTP